MDNQPRTQHHATQVTVDAGAVAARLDGLASAGICPRCAQVITPLTADTRALLIEVIRLEEELAGARLESANRLAAMRATLGADQDGETDPLAYLRWELPEKNPSPETGRGRG